MQLARSSRRPRRTLATGVVFVACVAGASALPACSAARPSIAKAADPPLGGELGNPTGFDAVDAVLQRLEGPTQDVFTAMYAVTRKLGSETAEAEVAKNASATSVTIGLVRYLISDAPKTCNLNEALCERGIIEARTSNLGIGASFWRDNPARALRVTTARRSGPPTASTATIGGQEASCVAVPVGQGTETYCALAAGAIARWDTAYVTVELESLAPTADPSAFQVPG
jgi:hypothetical protein